MQPIIVIVGPTASGKTGLAVELARRFGGEVISADSRQVYKALDIGTGKVTKREMRGVLHHCLDIAKPSRAFSVTQWRAHAQKAVEGIASRGKVPIIAGGTGFYIDALVHGIDFPAVKPNTTLRKTLGKKAPEELLAILKKLDPTRAKTIEQKNPRRLIRAIEIATALGKVPALSEKKALYDVTWIGINPEERVLEEKIHTRLIARMRQGMVAEVKNLHTPSVGRGLSWNRLDALGLEYRYLSKYLQGMLTKEEMLVELERAICQYAHRQMTWFKRNKEIRWFTSPDQALSEFPEIRSRHQ